VNGHRFASQQSVLDPGDVIDLGNGDETPSQLRHLHPLDLAAPRQ
jgi:hypothetical protein